MLTYSAVEAQLEKHFEDVLNYLESKLDEETYNRVLQVLSEYR